MADGEYCEASITNIHTHGLHTSPESIGDYHGDDILVELEPGESASYQIEIPENHMGGTFWYHPHHHHSTALQAGGGAVGALIVDDPPGYLPEVYANMVEKIIFISCHQLALLAEIA